MSLFEKLFSSRSSGEAVTEKICINLRGQEREDGSLFVTSPELEGFNITLWSNEWESPGSFMKSVEEPLAHYIGIYLHAELEEAPPAGSRDQSRYQVFGIEAVSRTDFLAKVRETLGGSFKFC